MRYIVAVCIMMSSLFANVEVESCDHYYSQGIAAYESEQYAQAIQFFESCESQGVESWVLYYNLGNAWYRNGSLGKAIVNYEKSLLLNPGETDVIANLEYVRAFIKDKQVDETATKGILDTWYRYMTLNASYITVLIVMFLIFISISMLVLIKGPARFTVYPIIVASSFVLLVVIASIGFRLYMIHSVSHGVLISDSSSVMSGPGKNFEVLFEIHEGTKFEIVETNDQWLSINLGGAKMGYIQQNGVALIH